MENDTVMKRTTMKKLYYLLVFLVLGFGLNAQIHIQGIVLSSENQKPLESVRVQVKNSDLFVVTDKEGHYALSLAPKGSFDITSSTQIPEEWQQKPTLIFSLNGFLNVEKTVEKSGQLDLELPILDLSNAGELVDLKTTTTSIGVLGGHQILQPYTGASLNGKIAGLQTFGAMNAPGEDVLFQLRSVNALASSQQPLIVLDGVWLDNVNLSDIHPEDIAYIEVLKGAASTAFYGSRGGNGVIKITTRRGADLSTGQSRVTFQSEYGFSQPDQQYNLNTKTNRKIINNSGPQPVLGNPNASNTFTTDLPALKDYQNDLLFQNGTFQSNYIAVENQAGNTNFLASVHRLEDVGILKFSDGYTRNALRFNLDHQLNKKWQFCAAAAYTFSNQDIVERGENSLLANTLSLTPIFDLKVPNEEDGSLYDWDIDNTGYGIINPLYWQVNVSQKLNSRRLLGNWTAKYQVNEALQFSYTALLDQSTQETERFVEKGFLSSVVPAGFSNQSTFGVDGSNGGGIFQSQNQQQLFLSQADALFNKRFLGVDVEAGVSFQYEELNSSFNRQQGENLIVSQVRSLDNPQNNIQISSNEQDAITYHGIGFAHANYKEKYSFDGVFRQEWSSFFGNDARSDNFYQAGFAYRLSEDFKIKGIQELKLRAAMGTAGIRPTFEQRFSNFQLQNGTVSKSILENPNLRPILVEEMEFGVDATIARALNLGFSYIQNTAKDQILLMPLSGGTGFEGQWQNAGTLSSIVYEADLNINISKLFRMNASGFRWNVRGLFIKMNTIIESLEVPVYENQLYRLEEGQAFGAIYGQVFATSLEQLADLDNINPSDYKLNNLGYVVHQDVLGTSEEVPFLLRDESGNIQTQIIGNSTPDFRMSFTNSLAFRGLELYALVDWKKGGDIYNRTKQVLYNNLRHAEVSENEDIAASFYEALYKDGHINNHFVEDGSYIMLREVALSYTLNQPSLFRSIFNQLQLSLIGRNLWTWTKYSGLHPDVVQNWNGQALMIDDFQYPSRRVLTGRIKVVF